jgi:hypothetical protein
MAFIVNDDDIRSFERDGYLFARGLFSSEETELLRSIAKADQELAGEAVRRKDASGAEAALALRNDLPPGMYSAIVRSERVAGNTARLLGDEVYHYHHKMNMKEPYVGGAWEWHQDYGYWYNNGCLFPDMASCMIAVDAATRENGCLQVIRGSHKMGRIEHGKTGDQTGANLERVEKALERMELVHCEMAAGDAVFFHSNLLHRSDRNNSPNPRWVLICCYNTRRNDPYKDSGHPRYSPLEIWPDECVLAEGRKQWAELSSR